MSADLDRARRAELQHLRRFTPARIGLGRVGTGVPTTASLQFSLDHARARDAVHTALDFDAIGEALRQRGWDFLATASAARDREQYLVRPDLGRRLSPASRGALPEAGAGCDIAVIVADGLSASAISVNLLPLLERLIPALTAQGARLAPVMLVSQGRVAIGDEIGERLGAKLTIMLIGERPGLSAADSLGCYVTFGPRIGTPDSARHCISNIRTAGLAPVDAADAIVRLSRDALQLEATGIELDRRRHALTVLGQPLPPPAEL